jgi:hypothetical protein
MHIDLKLYTKFPFGYMIDVLKTKDELNEWNTNLIYYVMNFSKLYLKNFSKCFITSWLEIENKKRC